MAMRIDHLAKGLRFAPECGKGQCMRDPVNFSDAASPVPPAIVQLVDHIQAFASVRRVILYGSRARGSHRPHSDVDLAVEGVGNPQEWLRIHRLADVEEGSTGTLLKIDLVQLERVDPAVRENILREGRILYERQ